MALNPTKNDLPLKARAAMVELLNARLADAIDLGLQLKQAHWNVKGNTFFQLHELFDKLAQETAGYVDDLAERCVQLGGSAEGTLQMVARRSALEAYPLSTKTGVGHLRAVADAMAVFGAAVRAAIDLADKAGDKDTADLFTEISRGADKGLWFVEAHLG
jgi:starvation-inducible DNA-binding protein